LQNLFLDFKSLTLSSKLIVLLPIAIVIGPLLSDGIVVITALIFIFYSIKFNNFFFFKIKLFQFFLLFWIVIIFSSFRYYPINSSEFFDSLKTSLLFIRFGFFFLVIYYACASEKRFISVFRKITFFTLCFVIFHSLIIYFFKFDFLKPTDFTFYNFHHLVDDFSTVVKKYENKTVFIDHRISGIFYDEAVLGTYLLKLGFLYFALSFYKEKNIQVKKLIIFLIILIFTIFITGDRSPFALSLLGLIMVFLILNLNIKKIQLITIFVIGILIILINLFYNPNLKNRYINQVFEKDKIEQSKIKIFERKIWFFSDGHSQHLLTALRIFNDNKLLGTGPKTFRHICKEERYKINKYSCTSHPHNTYGQLLAETGITGFSFILILFIIMTFIILKKIIFFKNEKNYNFMHSLVILFFLCLFPFIPTGSFFNNSISIYNFMIAAFVAFSLKQGSQFNKNKFINV
jgi:O-antigen ligase